MNTLVYSTIKSSNVRKLGFAGALHAIISGGGSIVTPGEVALRMYAPVSSHLLHSGGAGATEEGKAFSGGNDAAKAPLYIFFQHL